VQHGVVTVGQLHDMGITKRDIAYRVKAGRLHPIHRGVYAVGHRHLTQTASFIAAVLAVGRDAVLSHTSAAALWELRRATTGLVHVTVPRRIGSRRGIRIHAVRALPPTDVTRHHGIPVTTPARTVLDLADILDRRALERALHEAEVQRQVNPQQLQQQLVRSPGRKATTLVAELLAEGPAPTRSELEDRALALFRRSGLPQPQTNARVQGIEVDFLFPDARLIIEVDGARFHNTRFAHNNDAAKQARLEAAGYRVIRLTWHQVTQQPDQTITRIRNALSARVAD
jgi:very-short-patch-repair endonuclease/predicted transcriptional regulator of viral defense system